MARVIVTPEAVAALSGLIVSHSLPADTKERFRRSLQPLETVPRLGRELDGGGYNGLRFVLGPWRWMVIAYEQSEASGEVGVLTVQDARSSSAATNYRT
jgi:hypothetical protein